MDSLFQLLNLLLKYDMQKCALITFLEKFSEQTFDKNYRDNRQHTILHQVAVTVSTVRFKYKSYKPCDLL